MTDPQGWALAFNQFVGTLERIFGSPSRGDIIVSLLMIALALLVWKLLWSRLSDLAVRLDECDGRHEACEKRERRSLVALAQMHGVVCSLTEQLPPGHPARARVQSIDLPPLSDLMGGG